MSRPHRRPIRRWAHGYHKNLQEGASVGIWEAAIPHEQAASIIQTDSGSHFDPATVKVFIGREGQFKKLAAELADTFDDRASDTTARAARETRSDIATTAGVGGS